MGYGAAYTLPGIGITVYEGAYNEKNKIPSDGRQVLMHEYGHILQDRLYGHAVYNYVIASSLYSTGKEAITGWLSKMSPGYFMPYQHSSNWTEISASTLSYLYFGRPVYWDFNRFPINLNSISPEIIRQLEIRK